MASYQLPPMNRAEKRAFVAKNARRVFRKTQRLFKP